MSQQQFGKWSTGSLSKAKDQAEYNRILKTVPKKTGPGVKLQEFGYFYNENLELRQIAKPDEPFAWLGQKHYDFLGEAVVEEIYKMMETKYHLKRIMLPLGPDSAQSPPARSTPEKPRIPIFVSPNASTCDTLAVICQGVGAVRPGMWARSLCINNSLKDGTIFTYIEFCQAQNWGVIVMNPNENNFSPIACSAAAAEAAPSGVQKKNDDEEKKVDADAAVATSSSENSLADEKSIDFWLSTPDPQWKTSLSKAMRSAPEVEGSECQEDHGCYVWQNFVEPSAARIILPICHSYGGRVSTAIVDEFFESSITKRVACVAWTDAINDNFKNSERPQVGPLRAWMKKNSRNYVASNLPLGTPVTDYRTPGYDELSAGHKVHEWTSAACASHLFNFLLERHAAFLEKQNKAMADKNNKSTDNKKDDGKNDE